jgi:hypothetical protein
MHRHRAALQLTGLFNENVPGQWIGCEVQKHVLSDYTIGHLYYFRAMSITKFTFHFYQEIFNISKIGFFTLQHPLMNPSHEFEHHSDIDIDFRKVC